MVRLVGLILVAAVPRAAGLKIAITGSSQGIGLDAAKRLLADGHEIYHGCRSAARAEAAVAGAGGGVPLVCDLASLASVRGFAAALPEDLDVLCLNAGIAPSTKATAPAPTADGFEECIGTNHLGHFLLADLCKDRLRGKRLVVTASSVHDPEQPGGAVGGKGGATLGDLSGLGRLEPGGPTMVDGAADYDGGKVYKDSKLCNVLFAREALRRLPDVRVVSFNPGFIPASGLFRAPREDNWLGATAFTFFAGLAGFAVPIEVGGERLAYMATADLPSGSYLSADTGSRAASIADGFDDGLISKEGSDDALAAKLWDRS
eukprot:CAMPEP_0119269676 /NCGR_PEP_ID=MMETSP1329-20130426/6989_1 /TAXON_ID=114041 /ORGANISM="Genus nov. species nov., Strain RCC1024" /LENGTH=317 /DNA_ID=CAMNT_0007269677 /DNA_START=273 /DNA_END=1222 /DNA_ORIENTATION=-